MKTDYRADPIFFSKKIKLSSLEITIQRYNKIDRGHLPFCIIIEMHIGSMYTTKYCSNEIYSMCFGLLLLLL